MKIYYPNEKHIFTIIILHGMYGHSSNYETLVDNILNISKNIKIIVPNSPIRDIDWPAGKEYNVRSWYNYFTRNDGLLEHDIIETEHFYEQTTRITTIIDNDAKGANMGSCKSRGGHVLKTFKQRINGKDGRFRSNLMGKRVDYSARSVITPDPNIKIDQLGVPFKIAMNLTYPEIVNKYNINEMYKLIKNGNKIYPGAKSYKNTKQNHKYL